ncbi:hypothetical protein TNCV_4049791 [Trichonephila clavipes]|nr:hypothetical protein TNCV_4049791 [Trichonephila clavipes]
MEVPGHAVFPTTSLGRQGGEGATSGGSRLNHWDLPHRNKPQGRSTLKVCVSPTEVIQGKATVQHALYSSEINVLCKVYRKTVFRLFLFMSELLREPLF